MAGDRPPLTGVRVLDVSTILAGPHCCQIPGDFGADVIKIEHPKGDGFLGHGPSKDGNPLWWKDVARNKRPVGVDVNSEGGAAVTRRLAATGNSVVENFRPGTLERWGLGADQLRRHIPLCCSSVARSSSGSSGHMPVGLTCGSCVSPSKPPGDIRFTGRPLGADTDEVLRYIGHTDADIARLKGSEAIR